MYAARSGTLKKNIQKESMNIKQKLIILKLIYLHKNVYFTNSNEPYHSVNIECEYTENTKIHYQKMDKLFLHNCKQICGNL